MALGLQTESSGGGDITPIVKWDAKAGDLIKVDRENDGSGWVKNETEMTLPISFAMDFDNMQIGWLSFATGAPDFQLVNLGERMPPKPSDDHKQCFRVKIASGDLGLREFSHSAKTVMRAMDKLHDQFVDGQAANAGKTPVVTIGGTETVKIDTPQGELRFKVPEWSITQWIDRPAMFDGGGATAEPTMTEPQQSAPDAGASAPAGSPPPVMGGGKPLF
jgi:hypothetical protein